MKCTKLGAGEKGCLGSVSVAALLAPLMCSEFSCSHLWNGTGALLMGHPELCDTNTIPILTKCS